MTYQDFTHIATEAGATVHPENTVGDGSFAASFPSNHAVILNPEDNTAMVVNDGNWADVLAEYTAERDGFGDPADNLGDALAYARRLGRYSRQLLSHKRSGDVIAIEINNETAVVRATGALHHSEQDLPLSEYEIDEIELGLDLNDWTVVRSE